MGDSIIEKDREITPPSYWSGMGVHGNNFHWGGDRLRCFLLARWRDAKKADKNFDVAPTWLLCIINLKLVEFKNSPQICTKIARNKFRNWPPKFKSRWSFWLSTSCVKYKELEGSSFFKVWIWTVHQCMEIIASHKSIKVSNISIQCLIGDLHTAMIYYQNRVLG